VTGMEKLVDLLHRRHVSWFLAATAVVMFLTLLKGL